MVTRRQFVTTTLATAAAPPLAGLYTWLVEPHWLEISRPVLPIVGLPPALEGATMAHLTDVHVGRQVSDRYVRNTFRRLQAINPDFVVATGDWMTYEGPAQLDQLERLLEDLPHGRLGTLGVLGNHDYGFRWRMSAVADAVQERLERAGMRTLRNESVSMHGLQFLGLDDLWSPRFGPVPMLSSRAEGPSIALCHNPDMADEPVWGDYRGWVLCGHTHGGQCKPPFLPPPLLPVQNRRYTAGVIPLDHGRQLYISRGVGHLLKVRFNARPEVPVFRLARA